MIDINAIINEALNEAIAQAIRPLAERIVALEIKLTEANLFHKEIHTTSNISHDSLHALVAPMVESLIDSRIDEALSAHQEEYDHDEYDRMLRTMEDHDLDDFVKSGELEDSVKEAVSNLTFEISVS